MCYSNGPLGQSKEDVAGASAVDRCRNCDAADVPVNISTGEHAETGQTDSGTQTPEKSASARRRIGGYRDVFRIMLSTEWTGFALEAVSLKERLSAMT